MGIAPAVQKRRAEALRDLLVRLRDETYMRVREFRRDQSEEAEPAPADDIDQARSTSDVETHAALIERAEDRLRLLDQALARLDNGTYGICGECGEEIPLERMKALPFAAFCVDCQEKLNRTRRWGAGGTIQPYDRQWSPPEEMEEPVGREYRLELPEEASTIHYDEPFGPEEPTEEAPRRRRGRPRKERK